MKPWMSIYRAQHDWRADGRLMLEIRFGGFGLQAGVLLPRLGFSLWRNRDFESIVQWRWAPIVRPAA